MNYALNSEVFLLPDSGQYLLYAPLRGCFVRAEASCVNLLVRLQRGALTQEDESSEFLAAMVAEGVVNGPPERAPAVPGAGEYAPTRGTLLLTNRCNLACVYCYASAGAGSLVMDETLGKAAIDFLIGNCLRRERKVLDLGFHGGGEPTMAWKELTALTAHAQAAAKANGLALRLGIATNACLPEYKARWIARNCSHVNVSLDGPPEIQDRLRPKKGGAGSSGDIRRTLRILEAAEVPYAIQATVTRDTVASMPAAAEYFARELRPHEVKFEPVSICGRYTGRETEAPLAGEFIAALEQAHQVGQAHGLRITFSGIRLGRPAVSHFCGAFGEPFNVMPDGFVSACYEACSGDSEYAGVFLIGRYDRESQSFEIAMDKLGALRERHVFNLEPCRRCFCKYSCAGDCATRNFRVLGNEDLGAVGARCEMIREVFRRRLLRLADEHGTTRSVEGETATHG